MKTTLFFKYWSMIFGTLITIILLIILGPKIIGKTIEEGFGWLFDLPGSFAEFWSDPGGFFLIYLIGYAIAFWKPLWGSLIIIANSILFAAINYLEWGPVIFAVPTFLVGLFYIIYWILARKHPNFGDEHEFNRFLPRRPSRK